MPSTRWTVRTLCSYAMPFFLLFLLHLRFFLFFLSSFYSSSPFSLRLFLFLFPPPFVSPLLHFLFSIPSRALLRSRLLFYLLFSPRLIFAKASSRLAGVRGPKFRSPPPWGSIFKGSHLFSSFCLLFLRFLHRPASPAYPPLFGIRPIPPPVPLLPLLPQLRAHRFFPLLNGMEYKLAPRTPSSSSSSFSSSSSSSTSSSSSSSFPLSFQALPPYIFHTISLSLPGGLKLLFLTQRKKAGLSSFDRIVTTRTSMQS